MFAQFDDAAARADVQQAAYFRSALVHERGELEFYLAGHVKQLTECMTTGRTRNSIAHYRRCIRDTEAEIRRIARMLYALDRRFPDTEVSRRA